MAIRLAYDMTLSCVSNGTSDTEDDMFTIGRYDTMTIQHAVSSVAQSSNISPQKAEVLWAFKMLQYFAQTLVSKCI